MKYYLIAGEASGDLHASNLMNSIKKKDRNASFRFFGGDLMQKEGGTLVKHYREMAFMGFIPVLLNLKTILKNLEISKKDIVEFAPDVVILIDYPGFNLKIAKFLKKKTSIPVTYYISPKIWAWKEYRIKSFKKYVDQMLSILPFEVDFYKKHNYPVNYVGNPTVDAIKKRPNSNETFDEFIQKNNLPNKPIIALLAGSRKQEIEDNLPVMLKAIEGFRDYQIIIAGAPGIEEDFYDNTINNNNVNLIFGQTYNILAQAQAALVTSGTATLEAALLNTPQVVCYRTPVPRLAYFGFRYLLHTPYISLVNLIADKEVVKELFAKFFTIKNIREETEKLLFSPTYRTQMLDEYAEIQQLLGDENASDKAAQLIYDKISH
ncbi:MAG: lipid-A-disaccharide synthase [Dysgonamonadaceae bacterium]|nr:lipid-A-disaccharide synthase [Dysgonamonadaceae bacterium]